MYLPSLSNNELLRLAYAQDDTVTTTLERELRNRFADLVEDDTLAVVEGLLEADELRAELESLMSAAGDAAILKEENERLKQEVAELQERLNQLEGATA